MCYYVISPASSFRDQFFSKYEDITFPHSSMKYELHCYVFYNVESELFNAKPFWSLNLKQILILLSSGAITAADYIS